MRPDELPFEVRRSRRISNESSCRRIVRLVPVFTLETHNRTNYKCLPKFVQTDNASSSIKTANEELLNYNRNVPSCALYLVNIPLLQALDVVCALNKAVLVYLAPQQDRKINYFKSRLTFSAGFSN